MVCRGAFKFRGACNAVLSLSANDARKTVTTHSRSDSGDSVVVMMSPPSSSSGSTEQFKRETVHGDAATYKYLRF